MAPFFQMFNHGLSSAMMFLLVGVIYDRAHHREIERFGGLGLQMPRYLTLAIIGFFASLGLPGFSGFISEVMVFLGAFEGKLDNRLSTARQCCLRHEVADDNRMRGRGAWRRLLVVHYPAGVSGTAAQGIRGIS